MGYEEFKAGFLAELKDFYGEDAVLTVKRVERNNGQGYDGLSIALKDAGSCIVPVIGLDLLYGEYCRGGKSMDRCVETAYRMREEFACPDAIRQLAEDSRNWDHVKNAVYPFLLSTKENKEMLRDMVSGTMLDLSIVYAIRGGACGEWMGSIKINRPLLDFYGVSLEELHRAAMKNMEEDGYCFRDMAGVMGSLLRENDIEIPVMEGKGQTKMYILTNSAKQYGAAGILNQKLVREFAKGRSFFILPSSIHESATRFAA